MASVQPVLKKRIQEFRRPRIFQMFFRDEIYESFFLKQLKLFINSFLSECMPGYRQNCSTNHILIRLIGCWKKVLDEKLTANTVFIHLSKAFDCITHSVLISCAYGFSQKAVTFIHSHLKRRKRKSQQLSK